MNKSEIICSLLNDITEHCIDMKDTIKENVNMNEIDEDIKNRLSFKILYLRLAIQSIEYYL